MTSKTAAEFIENELTQRPFHDIVRMLRELARRIDALEAQNGSEAAPGHVIDAGSGKELTWEHLTPTQRKVLRLLPANGRTIYVGHPKAVRALDEMGLVNGSHVHGTEALDYACLTEKGLALRAAHHARNAQS